MLLERTFVGPDTLQRRIRDPTKQSRNIQVLVRVHFDIVDLRVASHRCISGFRAGEALRPDPGRMNVGEIDAPLLPPRRLEFRPDETQQALPMPDGAFTEQD